MHIHDRYIAEREILESVYVIFKENVFPIVVYAIWRNNKLGVDLFDKNPKVLILTAHYGNGHVQVAKTLEQTFRQKGIKDVIVCDLFENHIRL